jgi:hypothetical protein
MSDLEADLATMLSQYTNEVTQDIKKAIDIVADEVNEEIKSKIHFKQRTGDYVKGFRIKRSAYEDKYNKRNTWYVADGQYRLTHLLEYGHAKRNGGRVEAFPHIRYGEELAIKRMTELAEKAVQK